VIVKLNYCPCLSGRTSVLSSDSDIALPLSSCTYITWTHSAFDRVRHTERLAFKFVRVTMY
jgi:hypothetical protein